MAASALRADSTLSATLVITFMYAFACVITLRKCAVRCSKFRLIGFLRFAIWGVAALSLCCVIAVYNLMSQLEKEGIY